MSIDFFEFYYTGGFQTWTVPATGVYTITAFGAQGGSSFGSFGSNPIPRLGGFGAERTVGAKGRLHLETRASPLFADGRLNPASFGASASTHCPAEVTRT